MQTTITKNTADKAKAKTKAYRIHDTKLPGFTLRVQPSGVKSWVLLFQSKTRTLGRYPTMTVVMAREKARRIINGEESMTPVEKQAPSSTPTLGEFIDDLYRTHLRAHQSRPKEAEALIMNTGMGDSPLDDIDIAAVDHYRNLRLGSGTKHSTLNRQIGALKACLQKAVEWKQIEEHPLANLKPLKVDDGAVVRYLSPDEGGRLEAALLHATPWLRTFVTVALHTGLRRGELWSLKWVDVDLDKRMLVVHGGMAKSGQTRHVSINDTAHDALAAWRHDGEEIFGHHEFKKSWATLLRRADIQKFTFHCCRHHFASKLVMAGCPLNTVRELLGHQDLKMTLRYSHLAPSNLHDAVSLIG